MYPPHISGFRVASLVQMNPQLWPFVGMDLCCRQDYESSGGEEVPSL